MNLYDGELKHGGKKVLSRLNQECEEVETDEVGGFEAGNLSLMSFEKIVMNLMLYNLKSIN